MTKIIIIISYILMTAFDKFIDYLNDSYLDKPLPDNVKDVYDEEEFSKWQSYEKESGKVDTISELINFAVILAILIFNFYALVFERLSGFSIAIQYLIFTLIITLISDIISLPFSYYDTFVIEEKYGMNTTTKKTFIMDKIKGFIVSILIEYALIMIMMLIFEHFGNAAIVIATMAVVVISVVVSLIIIPILSIYNKFIPLQDGELKSKLLGLCDKYGIQVKKVVIRDASRRTTKSNAFCTGFGKKKTIALDDNLVNNFSDDEIVAVFAHEFAHAKFRHSLKSMPFSILQSLVIFAGLYIVLNIKSLYLSFGFTDINYFLAFTLLTITTWPLTIVLGMIRNWISRKHEYEADGFAAKEGYGECLIAALKRLNKEALSDINPHPVEIVLNYTHPSLSQRIDAIRQKSN